MDPNYEMFFENTVRIFLGDDAYHIAGQAHSEKSRKSWYLKVLKRIIKRIQEIDTNTKHMERLSYCSEAALKALKERPYRESEFTMHLLRLVGALLGFAGMRGSVLHTPFYCQTPDQHFTERIFDGADTMEDYYERENAASIRKDIVSQLKSQGLTDFQISLVLKTTEYEVKKLKKGL
jgi:hypothetical protein